MLSCNDEETKMLDVDKDCMQILFLNSKTIARKSKRINQHIFPARTVVTALPLKGSKLQTDVLKTCIPF